METGRHVKGCYKREEVGADSRGMTIANTKESSIFHCKKKNPNRHNVNG
jgi:hypothetical protein